MCDADAVVHGAKRVLFVHAHPDDETLATGGLIAALVDAGRVVGVLTATRGEQGEIVPGSVRDGADLSLHREAEVKGACRALGVRYGAFLGEPPARAAGLAPRRYTDSGMSWTDDAETVAGPGETAGPDALSLADPVEVALDVAACARDFGADLLVSYDAAGGYGHPDHVALAEPSRVAAERVGIPCLEIASDPGGAGWTIETPELLGRVREALAHHASQLVVDGAEVVHVGGQRQAIQLTFTLRMPAS